MPTQYVVGTLIINAAGDSQIPDPHNVPAIFQPDNVTQTTTFRRTVTPALTLLNNEALGVEIGSFNPTVAAPTVRVERTDGGGNWTGVVVLRVVAVYDGGGFPEGGAATAEEAPPEPERQRRRGRTQE